MKSKRQKTVETVGVDGKLTAAFKRQMIQKFTSAVRDSRVEEWILDRDSFVLPSDGDWEERVPSGTVYYTVKFWEQRPVSKRKVLR